MLKRLLQSLRRTMPPESLSAVRTAPAAHLPRAPDTPAPTEPLLLDVRTEREFAAASLQGSVHLPLGQVEALIDTLAPDRRTPLLVVCASGARSGAACLLLRQLGYGDVTNVGGLYGAAATLGRPLR
jgi:phage shock protein E